MISSRIPRTALIGLLLILPLPCISLQAQPSPAASAAFDRCAADVEAELLQRLHSPTPGPDFGPQPSRSSVVVEKIQLRDPVAPPGALLHQWRARAFVPGASLADFERLLRDINAYPRVFAPQVISAHVDAQHGDAIEASLRVRQKHVLTVTLDSSYHITFCRTDPKHGYSISRSTRVAEIDSPGTASEHPVPPAEDHGFLWRQNTYWTYVERDGGLFLQIESVSLSRSIPRGLAWAVGPYVESIPRESLEFTLRSAIKALAR